MAVICRKGEFVLLNEQKYSADLVIRKAFNYYSGQELPPKEMKGYHFNPLRTLEESIDSLGNALRLNRELIFESIRQEYYPELPSRQKCVWLIPKIEESLDFWGNIIRSKQQRIFKVSIDGKIHRSSHKWLNGGTFSVNKWYDLAHKYWKGEGSGNYDDEIILEGKMKLLEEITVPINRE